MVCDHWVQVWTSSDFGQQSHWLHRPPKKPRRRVELVAFTKYIVSLKANYLKLYFLSKKRSWNFLSFKDLCFFWWEVFHPIRSFFFRSMVQMRFFSPAETLQEMRTWLTLLVVNIPSSTLVNPWVWRPLRGKTQAVLCVMWTKIWCTFTSWYYGEHIQYLMAKMRCFLFHPSWFLPDFCPGMSKKNLTVNFFWETFLFGQCPCFFFLPFWNLWNQHRRNVCVYFFPRFSMQWTWMWASLRTTPPGATKFRSVFGSDMFFFHRQQNPERERETSRYIRVVVVFSPGVPRKMARRLFFFWGGSLKWDVLARNPATYKDWSRTWEQTTSGKEEMGGLDPGCFSD